jgi:hypothetical protein
MIIYIFAAALTAALLSANVEAERSPEAFLALGQMHPRPSAWDDSQLEGHSAGMIDVSPSPEGVIGEDDHVPKTLPALFKVPPAITSRPSRPVRVDLPPPLPSVIIEDPTTARAGIN